MSAQVTQTSIEPVVGAPAARAFSPRELDVLRSLGVSAAAGLAHAYARPRAFGDPRASVMRLAKSLEDLDPGTA